MNHGAKCLVWQDWATNLLDELGRQPLGGEHGDDAAREIIAQLAGMAPGVPRCSRCGCFVTLHEVDDDEERRGCTECLCLEFEAPSDASSNDAGEMHAEKKIAGLESDWSPLALTRVTRHGAMVVTVDGDSATAMFRELTSDGCVEHELLSDDGERSMPLAEAMRVCDELAEDLDAGRMFDRSWGRRDE